MKSKATGYGYDQDVIRAAHRWRAARMAVINSDIKADNKALWNELGNAEDALSKAVEVYEQPLLEPNPDVVG